MRAKSGVSGQVPPADPGESICTITPCFVHNGDSVTIEGNDPSDRCCASVGRELGFGLNLAYFLMTASRASLIAAIGAILNTASQLSYLRIGGNLSYLRIGGNFVFAVLIIAAWGLGWTLFLLASHRHRGQIRAEVRRAARIAGCLILADMVFPPIYSGRPVATSFFPLFRSAAFPFFGGSLPAVLGLAVLAAFAFSPSIWLIRAACLAFALVQGAYYLPRQWRAVAGTYAAWNQIFDLAVQYPKFFHDLISTASWTFAWVSLVGFLIAFAATQPRFGENRTPVQDV